VKLGFWGKWVFAMVLIFAVPNVSTAGHKTFFNLEGDPEDYTIRIQPRVWFANNNALDVEYEDKLPGGTKVVLNWDAGLDSQIRAVPFIEFKFWKRHKIRAEFLSIDQDEEIKAGDVTVTIGGTTLPPISIPNTTAFGEIKLTAFQIGYQYDLFQVLGGYISPFIDIAITEYDLKTTVTYDSDGNGTPDRTDSASDDDIYPIPLPGLAWRVYPHRRIAFFGEVKGMGIGEKDFFVQGLAGLEFQINQHLAFEAGFRYLYLALDIINDVELSYEDSGAFVGTVFSILKMIFF